MRSRILVTEGTGSFKELAWSKPDITSDEIEVKAVYTGVCRSDIDMMEGNFPTLPMHMSGHEGVGVVTKVGKSVTNIKIGDYVATRGEPAYSDYYNVRNKEFVRIPELNPKYILEPVACGINVVDQPMREIAERSGPGRRLLILGSGFLAWIAYNTVLINHLDFEITVIGSSNKDLWGQRLGLYYGGKFDVVIDLSSRMDVFEQDILHEQALVVFGSQKKVTTDFSNLLWKACTMVFPSPRTENFYHCMVNAKNWVEDGRLPVDKFWTRGYDRDTEWQQAFNDAVNRPDGYSRGYIQWPL